MKRTSLANKAASLLVLIMIAAGFAPVWAQQRRAPNVVRVVVTHHGLRIQPARIRAGAVRVLLENRTLLDGTAVSIASEAAIGQAPLKRMVLPEKVLIRKSWHDVVLTPGQYRVWIEKAPQVRTTFSVEP